MDFHYIHIILLGHKISSVLFYSHANGVPKNLYFLMECVPVMPSQDLEGLFHAYMLFFLYTLVKETDRLSTDDH